MDKVAESSKVQAETEPTLGTFSEEIEDGDTDEGPENDSDYGVNNRIEYDDDFYKQLGEIELEKSENDYGDIEDEIKEVELEESSTQAAELRNVSYFSSSEDESIIEEFSRNLKSYTPDDELDFKALDHSELNLTSEFNITESQGLSREDYIKIVGEPSLMDYDYDDFNVTKKESSNIKKERHRKISREQQNDSKDSKNEQLKSKLLQEVQIQKEQEKKVKQLHEEQIHQKKVHQRQQLLIDQQEISKENLQEQSKNDEKEFQLQLEEEKLKEQLRREQKREPQKLLHGERQLHISSLQPQQKELYSTQAQRSVHEGTFGIKSQNAPYESSLSVKSFHLPDISLSQHSDVREFRRMSNIFGNNNRSSVAALRTLTDNYRQLEQDKQNADVKVNQLENQLEQYRRLIRKEQEDSGVGTIVCGIEGNTEKNNSQRKVALSEKEKTDPSVVSLQKKYKAVKRQLKYMKNYARKAEDERDEAKKALFNNQQDIVQMNDQYENLRSIAQPPNKRNFPPFNTTAPIQQASARLPLNEKNIGSSNVNRSKDSINIQGNKQVFEQRENICDSGSEKSKSIDPEQIKKIQEEIENSRVVRENLRTQRQAMSKTRRKKEALESEKRGDDGDVEGNTVHKKNPQGQRRLEENYEDLHKEKNQFGGQSAKNRYIDSYEQQYDKETYDNSNAFNKRTVNEMQFMGDQYDNYRKYYEHYEDEDRGSSKSSQSQYIDPWKQKSYNEKREDQRRDNRFMRLPKGNRQYFDIREDENFSEQEDDGDSSHLYTRQRQFFSTVEDLDTRLNDLRQSPTRDGRVSSRHFKESQDNVYTHIKGRKQYVRHSYTPEESDYIEDCDLRKRLNISESSVISQQDFPIWRDVKNSKSYLRKRNYNVQETIPPKSKPIRPGNIGREIPFILGTGTGKSHSVTVNLQKAFTLLKNHNPNSCSVCNKKTTDTIDKNKSKKSHQSEADQEEAPDIALGRIIGNLMDELKHLKMHYINLVEEYQKIDPLNSKSKRSVLTEEMKEVMDQMETKGDQIATLYDIQQTTIKSLSSRSRYGLTENNNSQKSARQIHEKRAEGLYLLRGTQRVQKTLNDI